MKIAMGEWDGRQSLVARKGDVWIDLCAGDPSLPNSLDELLHFSRGSLVDTIARGVANGTARLSPPSRWLPPVIRPSKILCIGKNYADHAQEMKGGIPSEPVVFSKLTSTLIGHGDAIVLPKISHQVDYEAELVIVMGKRGREIPESQALDYVAGYCCGHDVSARDWQLHKPSGQWLLGKSFDTFAPLGPWMVTADDVATPGDLKIQLRLNGQVMQSSTTAVLIFSIQNLIAYISQICTLEPGDLIFTGTPSGVGVARSPQVFLQPGDIVEIEIDQIGTLRNSVIAKCD